MAIKEDMGAGAVSDHENRSPVLKEFQHSNRKRAHNGGEPDSPSTPHRNRTEVTSTTSAGKNDGFSPDSSIRRLLNAPARSTSESLFKTVEESPAKDEARTVETCKSPEQAAEVPSVSAEILDPTPAVARPKDVAIRCLLDLPRLDQRQTAKTNEAASLITPMPRHDPSDSPMMTQLKLHLAYAFHKLARNAVATDTGSSSP